MRIIIDSDKCSVCCECINICPCEVLGIRSGKVVVHRLDDCELCEYCLDVCENEAIGVYYGRDSEGEN